MCSGGFVEVAVLLSLESEPGWRSRRWENLRDDRGRVGIGVTASVLAQPAASTVQQHMAKLWVLWHCWARIEDAATVSTGSVLVVSLLKLKLWLKSIQSRAEKQCR